jgi:SAM-dependent methyltransferase
VKTLEWLNEREFVIDGVAFECTLGDYSEKTNRERFVLLKDRAVLEQYATVFADAAPKNILEFGIFQGGSPALFSLWFDAAKFVGIDICKPVAAFDEFCRTHEVGSRIRTHYGVSQTDRERIEAIVREEFGATPLDIIIDDASHYYRYSRRTFEIAFPLLRPGGAYVIEDWGWAHWPESQNVGAVDEGQTPLSMLIMELVMLCASRGDLVSEVRIFPAFAFIWKSTEAQPVANFALDTLYRKRGIELIGSRNLNLAGVSRLLAARTSRSVRRELQRMVRRLHRRS